MTATAPKAIVCRRRAKVLPFVLGAAFLALSQTAPNAAPSAEEEVALALEAQSAREYSVMVAHLERSANMGHLPAQELLGIVLLGGESLYGAGVPRDYCGAVKWFNRAYQGGSRVGEVYNTLLNQLGIGREKCGGR
jgi:TPR repeat protein